jgi:TRAP transporter TAXI family solute receptor
MSYAWDGVKSFEADGKIDSFRVIGGLYEETVQIVTLRDDIKSVADLKGKAVSIGAPGSGVYFNAMDILGIYGIAETDIKAEYLSFGDSTDAMKDGKIDAAFIVAGAPTPAITDLSATNQVYLVSMEDDKIDALMAASPFYTKSVLAADTYDMADSANTVSVKATMIVAADVADDVVYNLTAGIFDNVDAITGAHAKGAELNLENAVSGMTVPFHAGAAKYYAEHGIDVAK